MRRSWSAHVTFPCLIPDRPVNGPPLRRDRRDEPGEHCEALVGPRWPKPQRQAHTRARFTSVIVRHHAWAGLLREPGPTAGDYPNHYRAAPRTCHHRREHLRRARKPGDRCGLASSRNGIVGCERVGSWIDEEPFAAPMMRSAWRTQRAVQDDVRTLLARGSASLFVRVRVQHAAHPPASFEQYRLRPARPRWPED